jgi:bacterioferritin-associated ferredoxin
VTLIFIFELVKLPAVIVCHCKGISDRDIRAAVRSGAACRHTVGARCAAGTGCGGCHAVIDEIIHTERAPEGRSGAGTLGRLAPSR